MQETIKTGIESLDEIIKGYPKDGITTFYGPAGAGKTNLILTAAKETIKKGDKVIVINTEGEIIIDRLRQIIPDEKLKSFIFLNAKSFEEQDKKITELSKLQLSKIGMITFDSSNKLLRAEMNKDNKEKYEKQLKKLKKISREKKIPILLTAQVYHSYDMEKEVIFSGTLIKEASDCICEIEIFNKIRKLTIKKHNNLAGEKTFFFEIKKEGITPFIPQ
ncbi:hypothetical protein DRJ25_00270 [Candidatus Woesearchaeota archaeon]|nr:MAG: hypothetical protein DRJ25_00270 [Candidatus Woesearchaeota archaeon]